MSVYKLNGTMQYVLLEADKNKGKITSDEDELYLAVRNARP
jgi:hypothetical protein